MHSRVSIGKADGGYILHIEAEGGEKLDLRATYDQLDLVACALDEQLDVDEDEALGADGERLTLVRGIH